MRRQPSHDGTNLIGNVKTRPPGAAMHPNGEAMPITDPALSVQGTDIPVVSQFEFLLLTVKGHWTRSGNPREAVGEPL